MAQLTTTNTMTIMKKKRNSSESLEKFQNKQFKMIIHYFLRLERIRNFFRQFARRINEQFSDDFDENQEVQKIESLYKQGLQDRFFKEDVEINDDENESFTDITIPDFKDGRSGRFLHDFMNNLTTIVDPKSKRCFVYPLDYNTTMPPKSFSELLQKMREG